MLSIGTGWPRFRGRTGRILAVYQAFQEAPAAGLHPRQVGLSLGMSALAAKRLLDAVPELFIRLPKRDGLTRYRLNSFATATPPEEVEALVMRRAKRETLVIYAGGGLLLLGLAAAMALLMRASSG